MWRTDAPVSAPYSGTVDKQFYTEVAMGKYFLAWIMGVPAIVLVLIYFFFH